MCLDFTDFRNYEACYILLLNQIFLLFSKEGSVDSEAQKHQINNVFLQLNGSLLKLRDEMYIYARDNLAVVNIYIKDAVVTKIRRDQKVSIGQCFLTWGKLPFWGNL